MKKADVIKAIVAQLEIDLIAAREAALATYEAATNEESKPENEYDTRAIEASYLAGAQAKRVAEIEELLSMYKFLEIKPFTDKDKISSTALIELDHNDKTSYMFIMAKGGGMTLKVDGNTVQVVTPTSPVGGALLGLQVGETAVVEVGKLVHEYEVLSIQ